MGLFDKKQEQEEETVNFQPKNKTVSTIYGRAITTAKNAQEELYFTPPRLNPVDYINRDRKQLFYGFEHTKDGIKPIYLPENEVTMQLLIGTTGAGKGILLGNFLFEKIQKREGVIVIDPKMDAFMGQIAKEELAKQGRPNDLLIANFPTDFCYSGINKDDTYSDIANKLIDAFGLEETGNPGVDYFRKNERVMLKKVLKLFFNGGLGEIIPKDLNKIAEAIVTLSQDLKKKNTFEEEMGKTKPNMALIKKTQDRYFDADKIEALNFVKKDVDTLESLATSFDEFVSSANISSKINLDEALYEGKVVYLKIDMLDIASLKFAKICITDAIQKARRKLPSTKIWIISDEISFYANKTLAGALATTRGFNLNFILALQDIAQMADESIRNAILSNVNVKIFYKPSDKTTLEYLEQLGGKEAVTKISKKENDLTISQDTEYIYNTTRVRALPRAGVAVMVSEFWATPKIIQTNFIAVSHPFKWEELEDYKKVEEFEIKHQTKEDIANKLAKYRQKVKGVGELVPGLLCIDFENEKL